MANKVETGDIWTTIMSKIVILGRRTEQMPDGSKEKEARGARCIDRPNQEHPDYCVPCATVEGYVDCVDLVYCPEDSLEKKIGKVTDDELAAIRTHVDELKDRFDSETEAREEICAALREKLLASEPEMRETMERISEVWGHDWIALFLDPRYVLVDDLESRFAVSYGANCTTPRTGLVAPDEQKGDMVFGVHNVVIADGNRLCLADQWFNSFPAENYETLAEVLEGARRVLATYSDAEYYHFVSFAGDQHGIGVSERVDVKSFEISNL